MKMIAFDVDGTVLNTLDSIIHHVNESLHENGFYRVDDREYFRRVLGYGSRYLIEKALIFPYNHIYDKNLTTEILEYYLNRYNENPSYETKPYDGILELLQELKNQGYILVAYSNKPDSVLQKVIAEVLPEGIFDYVTGIKLGMESKPNSEPFNAIIKELNVEKDEVMYIGDSEVDVQTAQNAGVTSVAVTWGFRDREFLEEQNPDYIVENVDELREVIKKIS